MLCIAGISAYDLQVNKKIVAEGDVYLLCTSGHYQGKQVAPGHHDALTRFGRQLSHVAGTPAARARKADLRSETRNSAVPTAC